MINHISHKAHLDDMMLHFDLVNRSAPVAFYTTNLAAQECRFPDCTFKTGENTFTTVCERQEEMKLHITMCHESWKTKCQTKTKVDRPALKAKVSALEWTLWKNAWQRYLKVMGLEGQAVVTQLWECLSSETTVELINAGFWEEETLPSR